MPPPQEPIQGCQSTVPQPRLTDSSSPPHGPVGSHGRQVGPASLRQEGEEGAGHASRRTFLLFGFLNIWYVAVLVFKLGAERSPPGPGGSSDQ